MASVPGNRTVNTSSELAAIDAPIGTEIWVIDDQQNWKAVPREPASGGIAGPSASLRMWWAPADVADGRVNIASLATGGNGTESDPWIGWNDPENWVSYQSYHAPAGHYSTDATIDFTGVTGVKFTGEGSATVFHSTAAGTAMQTRRKQGPSVIQDDMIEFAQFANFVIDGNANTTIGLDVEGAFWCQYRDITVQNVPGTAFRHRFCISCTFSALYTADDRFNSRNTLNAAIGFEIETMTLGGTPDIGNVNCNSYQACEAIGSTEICLKIVSGFGNHFAGGAYEATSGKALYIGPKAIRCVFDGPDFEGSETPIEVHGDEHIFNGCVSPGSKLLLFGNRNKLENCSFSGMADYGKGNQYDLRIAGSMKSLDRSTTAANAMRVGGSQVTHDNSAIGLPVAVDTTFVVPYNTAWDCDLKITAYCYAGPGVGNAYTWSIVKRFATSGGTVSQISDSSPAVSPPLGWTAQLLVYGTGSTGLLTIQVKGSTGDDVHWEMSGTITQNGGAIVPPTALERIISIVKAHGSTGFIWRAADATMVGSDMSIVDQCEQVNAIGGIIGAVHASPSIGTLADGTTPAIVTTDQKFLQPTGSLGESTSHTLIVVGEPNYSAIGGSGAYFLFAGSGSGEALIAFTQSTSGTNLAAVRVAGGNYATAARANDMQAIEFSIDASNDVAKIFRNGAQVATGACAANPVMGPYANIGVLGIYDYLGFGAGGAFTEVIYIPGAISANERALLYSALKTLHSSLP